MSLTYSTWLTTISTLCAIPETNPEFLAIAPNCIDYADNRIYRELDMVVENFADASSSTLALTRSIALPTSLGVFQVITAVNIITPASTAPDSGTRNLLQPVSREYLDLAWPSTTGATVPQYFNYFSQASGQPALLFGPWPDTTYRVEVVGKIIPAPLSASNPTTFLTTYLPDLYVAASMVYMTGYMKNFGAQGDDARQAVSWEAQYNLLKASAETWEARKRFGGASWTAKQVEPTAVPQRG